MKHVLEKPIRKYGWKPDLPSIHDYPYMLPHISLPSSIDLRALFPEPFDQGALGSCTSNALAGMLTAVLKIEKLPVIIPSRLFIYYNERLKEGTVKQDSGAYLRDGMWSLNHQGYCNENMWPYIIEQFTRKPKKPCYINAAQHTITSYHRLRRSIGSMQSCLAEGYPFVCGISVYTSFESPQVAETGIVPLPKESETLLGGHAIVCCGYDDATKTWLLRNSWGSSWGGPMAGYFTLPYDYLLNDNLSDDFWTIRVSA